MRIAAGGKFAAKLDLMHKALAFGRGLRLQRDMSERSGEPIRHGQQMWTQCLELVDAGAGGHGPSLELRFSLPAVDCQAEFVAIVAPGD